MRRSFKFGVLMAALALLSIGGNVEAQTDEPAQEIFILLWADRSIETIDQFATNLLSITEQNLSAYNITLKEDTERTDSREQIALRVDYYNPPQFITEMGIIGIEGGIDRSLHRQSPMLMYAYTYGPPGGNEYALTWDVADGDEVLIANANLLTGLVLYLTDHCDAAVPYLSNAAYPNEGDEISSMLNEQFLGFLQGNCAILAEDYEAAVSLFVDSIAELDIDYRLQTYMGVFSNLAWAYLHIDREADAIRIMDDMVTEANSIDNNYFFQAMTYAHRAQLYALAFHYDDAIADMDAAIEALSQLPQDTIGWRDGHLAEFYVLRGNITLLIYEWDRVLADYNTAIELAPDYADAYFYRGVFYYTRTEYDLALDDLNHYLELAPDGEHVDDATADIEEINTMLDTLGD